jgi:hypothetical protein
MIPVSIQLPSGRRAAGNSATTPSHRQRRNSQKPQGICHRRQTSSCPKQHRPTAAARNREIRSLRRPVPSLDEGTKSFAQWLRADSLRPFDESLEFAATTNSTWKALPPLPSVGDDAHGFLTHLAAALKANALPARDAALFGQLARIGLTDKGFDPAGLTPPQQKGLARAFEDGPKAAVSALATATVQRNGWAWSTGLDCFGTNYPLRALVAGPYLGAQGEREAMYPLRSTDSKGEQLDGSKRYIIRFASPPPVDAFWSLTVYNESDKMLIENPIRRYKFGSDTPGFAPRPDGSFDVLLQNDRPADDKADWLPTPNQPFYVILRLYQPREETLTGAYALPDVVMVA